MEDVVRGALAARPRLFRQITHGRCAATELEIVGGQEDRDSLTVQVVQEVEHLVAGLDVGARSRLVKQEQ